MNDNARMADFFKESKRVPFDSIPTVLIVGIATLETGTNLYAKNIFDNIPIYEIPGYKRGNNKKVKIPFTGIPYTVLSAKCGKEIRGIVKDLNNLKVKTNANGKVSGKGKFPNQVTLDITLRDKVVNVMIFKNKMKITGAQRYEHLAETFILIKGLLSMMDRKGIKVWDKSLVLSKLEVEMENVVFDLGYKIRRDVLTKLASEEEGFESPSEEDAARILYPMGFEKAKGGDRYFNFRTMHTGKVIFSGNNRQAMKPVYEKFMDFIQRVEPQIRFY